MLKQLFHGPFAEESQTIPGIIHSNIDRETGEPIGQPERTTFEPFRISKVPLESTSGEWSTGWEGPVAGTIIQSVDAREILGRGHSFVGGVSEQIELDIPGVGNGATAIGELTAKFGTDALGSYLPYHYFGLSRRSPWGIYLFPEQILYWSIRLMHQATNFGIQLSKDDAFSLAFMSVYRHELFHYHVERFAVREEVIQRKPIYLPYDDNVFSKTPHGEDWLEECLAQESVLHINLAQQKLIAGATTFCFFLLVIS